MAAYYNEFDPYAAQWLRNLIAAGHIAPGDVDERSILDVHPDDLKGYIQCHFFAGIAGWSLGARMAGWPDERPLWTGSCPCQPFSVAGKGAGHKDERHLWPAFFALIRARRPAVVMGEQVAAAVGKDWLDGVSADLEGIGYTCGAAVVPACAVGAPHRRDRLWFVADTDQSREGEGREQRSGELGLSSGDSETCFSDVAHASGERREAGRDDDGRIGAGNRAEGWAAGRDAGSASFDVAHASGAGRRQAGLPASGNLEADGGRSRDRHGNAGSFDGCGPWSGAEWAIGADGKARRVEPGIRLLAHGVPARVGKLRAYGNAIVPALASEIIGSYMDVQP